MTSSMMNLFGGAFAEDGRANADLRGAFFNGDFKIVAHAHGKLRQRAAELRLEVVAETAKAAEVRTGVAGIFAEGRNGHEAAKLEMRQLRDAFGESGKLVLLDAGFGFGGVELDLDENREPLVRFAGGFVEFGGKGDVVHGINPVEESSGAAGFVALKMADQMPTGLKIGELRLLRFPFLHAIFAEGPDAGFKGIANRFDWKGFRDGDEDHFLGAAIAAERGASDAFADSIDIFRDGSACPGHELDFSTGDLADSGRPHGKRSELSNVLDCRLSSCQPAGNS